MVTVAPERAGAMAFIEKLVTAGVVVAIGHTAANSAQLPDAVRAGARTGASTSKGRTTASRADRPPGVSFQLASAGLPRTTSVPR